MDTPALLVDLDAMERNINKMSAYCRTHNLLCSVYAERNIYVEIKLEDRLKLMTSELFKCMNNKLFTERTKFFNAYDLLFSSINNFDDTCSILYENDNRLCTCEIYEYLIEYCKYDFDDEIKDLIVEQI